MAHFEALCLWEDFVMCLKKHVVLTVVASAWGCFMFGGAAARGADPSGAATAQNRPNYQHGTKQNAPSGTLQNQSQDEPQPIKLSGNGAQSSKKFQLAPGLWVINMKNDGNSNLIVRLLGASRQEIDTVFN